MKKIIVELLIGIMMFSITSCGNNKKESRQNTENTNFIENESEESLENKGYEWVIEPFIEAEDIIVFDTSYVPKHGAPKFIRSDTDVEEYTETLLHDKFAIIKKDGKYGFIGDDGRVLVEPQYDSFVCHNCGEIFLNSKSGDRCYLDENSQPVRGISMCGDGYFNIEYNSSENRFVSEYWSVEMSKLDVAVPVIEKSDISVHRGEQIGKYGIYFNGELISEYQYDDYICNITSDTYSTVDERVDESYSFAMRKGDNWFLFDREGRQVLEDSCESIPSNSYYSDDSNLPYIFTEGICAVSQFGQMRYIDLNGNDVIPEGIFEELRPVYNGMAWVKKDGKWGVIRVYAAQTEEVSSTNNQNEITDDEGELEKQQELYHDNTESTEDIRDYYSELIEKYKNDYPLYDSEFSYCRYYLYDFEQDGISEILIETGTCEQDRKIDVYTLRDKNMFLLGSFISMHMNLAASDDFSYKGLSDNTYDYHDLYGYAGFNNEVTTYKIYVENDSVICDVYNTSYGTVSIGNKLESYSFDDIYGLANIE